MKIGLVDIFPMLLEPNQYSRSQKDLKKVNGVVVHYTANPGTGADANRNYFNGLKDTKDDAKNKKYVSSHFIIGLEGKIVQCIPLNEVAYASNNRNDDTISIECCHPDESGEFTEDTYQSLVKLTAWLCGEYALKPDDILRHYDITEKDCPRYFVSNEDKWKKFKKDVFDYLEENNIVGK